MIVIGVFYNLPIEKTREIESQIKRERERDLDQLVGVRVLGIRTPSNPLPNITLIWSPIFRYLISRSWDKYHKKITKFPFTASSVSVNFFIYLPFWNCS